MKEEIYKFLLDIPEAKSGNFFIVKKVCKALESIPVISVRTALFEGVRPLSVKFDSDVCFHYLKNKNGILMSDVPQEYRDMKIIADQAYGNVLVAGLGLGLVAKLLDKNKKVKCITIIEKSKDVIKLVWEYIWTPKMNLIKNDAFKFFKSITREFDTIILDIWSGDSEGEFYDTILPLKKLAKRALKNDGKILCWKENVALGQIKLGLYTKIDFDQIFNEIMDMSNEKFEETFDEDNKYFKVINNFFRIVRSKKLSREEARPLVSSFVDNFFEKKGDEQ